MLCNEVICPAAHPVCCNAASQLPSFNMAKRAGVATPGIPARMYPMALVPAKVMRHDAMSVADSDGVGCHGIACSDSAMIAVCYS